MMKSAFTCLREGWLQVISFEGLDTKIGDRLQTAQAFGELANEERVLLASHLMQSYCSSDLMELVTGPIPFVSFVSERPVACPLARDQTTNSGRVANRKHEVLRLNPVQGVLLLLLDGLHDHTALLAALTDAVEKEQLAIRQADEECQDPPTRNRLLANALEVSLRDFCQSAVLIVETSCGDIANGARYLPDFVSVAWLYQHRFGPSESNSEQGRDCCGSQGEQRIRHFVVPADG